MMVHAVDLAVSQGARLEATCRHIGVSARAIQRWRTGEQDGRKGPNTTPANALTAEEKAKIISTANSAEFRDVSPKQIVPRLADRSIYIASESSFYRVLNAMKLMKHRGKAKAPIARVKPDLIATKPGQVWTWDISYLPSVIRGQFFYLYMTVDIFSRRIVGFEVHERESSELAAEFLKRTTFLEGQPKGLTLHSDNGGPMRGITMMAMIQSLGLSASFSRARVSNDNPYSEALFRTVKYSALYPSKPFESVEEAMAWVTLFVQWYNYEHRHSGIQFVTPNERHCGRDIELLAHRKSVYENAKQRNPSRWSGTTRNWEPAAAVRLGQPRSSVKGNGVS